MNISENKTKTWKRGDKLKIADLNRFEEGIAATGTSSSSESSSIFLVTGTFTGETVIGISSSFNEIYTAISNNKTVFLKAETPSENDKTILQLPLISLSEDNKEIMFGGIGVEYDEDTPIIGSFNINLKPVDAMDLDGELEANVVLKQLSTTDL